MKGQKKSFKILRSSGQEEMIKILSPYQQFQTLLNRLTSLQGLSKNTTPNINIQRKNIYTAPKYIYLPPSDIFSTFPLFYIEILTLVFPCAYRTTVIKCPSISLSDILRHFVTMGSCSVSPITINLPPTPHYTLQTHNIHHQWKCFKIHH